MMHEENNLFFFFLLVPACNLQEADVIFLCDGSDMVSDSEFVTMTTFLSDLIDNFDIQSQRMKIGMAQYGSRYQEIIELESSLNKTQWKSRIQTMAKSKGFPRIDFALKHVSHMFHPSVGGRKNAGVPQMLVVITSGYPRYDVADAVKVLKDLGICVLALGIGDVYKEQLLPITGNPEKIITFQDFNRLMSVDVKKRMVREICQSCGKASECPADVWCYLMVTSCASISRSCLMSWPLWNPLRRMYSEMRHWLLLLPGSL